MDNKKRRQLAKTALELDPKNADAHLLMAKQELEPIQRRLHYLQAINTGYRNFTDEFDVAWMFVMNRPLLRALFAYGARLMSQGEYKEAIEQFEDILDKNPEDHQGAKWLLASSYIRAGRWSEAEDLLMEYQVEGEEILNHYFDCIMDIHEGDIDAQYIRAIKEEARQLNPFAVKLLKNGKNPGAFPRKLRLQLGNEDETKLVYWIVYGIPGAELLV